MLVIRILDLKDESFKNSSLKLEMLISITLGFSFQHTFLF